MARKVVKTEGTTTIEVSIATYNKLYSAKEQLRKILRRKSISFDVLFKIFFICQPLDVILQDMILENSIDRQIPKGEVINE